MQRHSPKNVPTIANKHWASRPSTGVSPRHISKSYHPMLSISEINEYRESKGRDPIQLHKLPKDSAAEQLQELDHATIDMLNHGGPEQLVDDLFQQIVNDSSNTWTQQSLWYRQLQTHYK